MATLSLTVGDVLYAATLASYPGVDDTERLMAWRKDIRQTARARVLAQRQQSEAEAYYARMRAIDAGAADLDT